MTPKRDYSEKLFHKCLEFFMHPNQDYMTRDYQDRYMDLLMEVMGTYGGLNERTTKEYQDAENRAREIKNCPVLKALE